MGSHGHRVDFDAAHSQATRFNKLARLGTVGTVFHACCLLETTTNAFHIRMLPNVPTPAGAVWSGLDITRLMPARGIRANSYRCCSRQASVSRSRRRAESLLATLR